MPINLASRTGSREDGIADVGDQVYVTSYRGCRPLEFDLSIHIWKPEDREVGHVCELLGIGCAIDAVMPVVLHEGAALETMSPCLDLVVAYMKRPGNLLIHCVAGMNRAPTLAVLAKMARGRGLAESADEVHRSNLAQRGIDQRIFPAPYASLQRWFARQREVEA